MVTALGYDEKFMQHRTGMHPERPARLTSIVNSLKDKGLWKQLYLVQQHVEPDPWILCNHSEEYIKRFKSACENDLPFIDVPDSAICPDSYEVARDAVAVVLAACDLVAVRTVDNSFCPVRPPGHHAEYDRSMGFCMFNNAAIAARYLQKQHGLTRIFILDWDVHHGNGTQHSFERDNTVYYCSMHQHPATLYPGTGWPTEIGEGLGRGFTLNLSFEPGAGDEEWLESFRENVLPAAEQFQPEAVLISAGFDGHQKDPLAQQNLTEEAYGKMTEAMLDVAKRYSGGRLISVLEGGYQLGALSSCVIRHVELLMEA